MKKQPALISTFPHYGKSNPPAPETDYSTGAVFLIDKPGSWSSFRPVGLLRRLTGIKRVGHAGTLDPMATGLLVLCVGKATKSISQVQDEPKTYIGEIQFGGATPSLDAETEVEITSDFSHITPELIREKMESDFTGEILQHPPMYSAVWHKGERLYKLARKGIEVERPSRVAMIHAIQLNHYDAVTGRAKITVNCGKGTYIRTIADDLGRALGTHGYLCGLRRTETGGYNVSDALTMEELVTHFQEEGNIDLS